MAAAGDALDVAAAKCAAADAFVAAADRLGLPPFEGSIQARGMFRTGTRPTLNLLLLLRTSV